MAPSTIVTVALFLVWLAAPVTTVTQFTGTQFGVAGGPTLPVESFQSSPQAGGYGFRVGWQGMAFVSYRGPDTRVGVQVDAGYAVNTSPDSINGLRPVEAAATYDSLIQNANLTDSASLDRARQRLRQLRRN